MSGSIRPQLASGSTRVGIAVLGAALCGCQQPQGPQLSGFIEDAPPMVRLGSGPGTTYAWFHPQKRIANYYSYIIDPVAVRINPEASSNSISPAELDDLAAYFRNEMIRQLQESGKYHILDRGGEGVLRVRTAITGVHPNKPGWNKTNVTRLTGVGLGGATMEGEIIDTGDGERIMAFVVHRPANRFSLAAISKWGSTEEILHYWAVRLRQAADNRWISEKSAL